MSVAEPRPVSTTRRPVLWALRIAAVLAAALAAGLYFVDRHDDSHFRDVPPFATVGGAPRLVAHAGGATADGRYSNSLQAIEKSYVAGIRWFEVDVSWTPDGRAVLLHDWERTWDYWFEGRVPQTLAGFEAAAMRGGRTQLSLASACRWLGRHSDARMILDFKELTQPMLAEAARACEPVLEQIAVYLPDPDKLARAARELGFKRLAVSNYYGKLSLADLEKYAKRGEFDFIDLGMRDFSLDEIAAAVGWGVPVIVWTVNDADTARRLREIGVAAVISDVLRPVAPDEK